MTDPLHPHERLALNDSEANRALLLRGKEWQTVQAGSRCAIRYGHYI
jgi:hypothetical protein